MKEKFYFKITEKNHTSLKNFSLRNFRTLQQSINFITNLYLENPEMFDFEKRIWTKEKKNKFIAVKLDGVVLAKITEIVKEKNINISFFLPAILDVYFVDNPVTSAPDDKIENNIF